MYIYSNLMHIFFHSSNCSLLVRQDVAVHNVQRILRQADDILAAAGQARIDLKHLFERRRVLFVVLVQNRVLVLCLDEFAFFAHTGIVVIEHNRAILLQADGGGVLHSGVVGDDGLLLLHL